MCCKFFATSHAQGEVVAKLFNVDTWKENPSPKKPFDIASYTELRTV